MDYYATSCGTQLVSTLLFKHLRAPSSSFSIFMITCHHVIAHCVQIRVNRVDSQKGCDRSTYRRMCASDNNLRRSSCRPCSAMFTQVALSCQSHRAHIVHPFQKLEPIHRAGSCLIFDDSSSRMLPAPFSESETAGGKSLR